MHSVLVRSYKYRYSREGIVPGTWYLEFLLDPKSVSLGRSEIARIDYDIVTVSGHRTIRTILVIDDKEYGEAQVKEHYAELKALFDRIYTEKLLEEIDDDQGSFEDV